jgi:hypothetical protein
LNPDFILELVKENMLFAPSSVFKQPFMNLTFFEAIFRFISIRKPVEVGLTPDPIFKKCSQILEALTKAVPGLIPGLFYLGKIKYLCGERDKPSNPVPLQL